MINTTFGSKDCSAHAISYYECFWCKLH